MSDARNAEIFTGIRRIFTPLKHLARGLRSSVRMNIGVNHPRGERHEELVTISRQLVYPTYFVEPVRHERFIECWHIVDIGAQYYPRLVIIRMSTPEMIRAYRVRSMLLCVLLFLCNNHRKPLRYVCRRVRHRPVFFAERFDYTVLFYQFYEFFLPIEAVQNVQRLARKVVFFPKRLDSAQVSIVCRERGQN